MSGATVGNIAGLLCTVVIAACGETTPPLPFGGAFNLASDSIEISAPGQGRVYLEIDDSFASPAITAAAPFAASIETSGGGVQRRVLVIDASGPGSGFIRVRDAGRADSVKVVATAVAFKTIAVTYGHACGIASDDRAWCWGGNGSNQIGANTTPACLGSGCQYFHGGSAVLPIPVSGDRKFSTIAASGKTCSLDMSIGACGQSCGVTAQGETYCWGLTGSGGGTQVRMGPDRTMRRVTSSLSNTLSKYGMQASTCGITPLGEAYCLTPSGSTRTGGSLTFTSFGTSFSHSCGLSGESVYCWGSNTTGELGIGSTDAQQHATPVVVTSTLAFTSVSVADTQTCAMGADRRIYCWGRGTTSPQPLAGEGTYDSFSLDLTSGSVCAVRDSGSVDCWSGLNAQPATVQSPVPFTAVSVGGLLTGPSGLGQSCGLTSSGEVYCWRGALVAKKLGAP